MPIGIYLHKPLSEKTKKKLSESHKKIRHDGNFQKGHTPWNKGIEWGKETREKIRKTMKIKKIEPKKRFIGIGKKHPLWRGKSVSYSGLHKWVERQLGKPKFCNFCESTKSKRYEWANINGEYNRNTMEFMRLCTSCHKKYDLIRKWLNFWEKVDVLKLLVATR
mgnify:CR=1 FL=1